MRRTLATVAGLWLIASPLARAQVAPPTQDGPEAWRAFEGTWSATGQRHSLPTETGRDAAVVQLSGAVVIARGDGLSRGFRAVVIGFDNGNTESVGRSVWTDDRGNRIYGTVQSDTIATGKRFVGTITGGTGRYAGITGSYEFTWQYVIAADDGTIQGRASGLRGRVRSPAGPR